MDQMKTGGLIRTLRRRRGLTQLALAERLGVSDKVVSKWERGRGAPDIALLPSLSEALGVDTKALLRGDLEENEMTNGNMKRTRFYICPDCGSLLLSTESGELTCCGRRLSPLPVQKAEGEDRLDAVLSDGEWYITGRHEMRREHYISFLALLSGDTVLIKKLYPEWGLEVRLPRIPNATLLWYCTEHGLFSQAL